MAGKKRRRKERYYYSKGSYRCRDNQLSYRIIKRMKALSVRLLSALLLCAGLVYALEQMGIMPESIHRFAASLQTGTELVELPSERGEVLDPGSIPEYDRSPYVVLNNNLPSFTEEDLKTTGEHYLALDSLGRCKGAVVMLDRAMRPLEERGEIGQIRPSGWKQNKYPGIVDSKPPYLYNRCHLIAYSMTGQNANEQNLITGTKYMNVEGMLPFEKQILSYMDNSDNHVLYRVTPVFVGAELLARGVELEAYSVEDQGVGICFHVFVYNVQPGIGIDYTTGENWEL